MKNTILLIIWLITFTFAGIVTSLNAQGWIRPANEGKLIVLADQNLLSLGASIEKRDYAANLIWSVSLAELSDYSETLMIDKILIEDAYERPDGVTILVGYLQNPLSGDLELYWVAIDGDANLIWEYKQEYSISDPADRLHAIAPTTDGGFMMIGTIGSENSTVANNTFVMKIRGDGSREWQRTYNTIDWNFTGTTIERLSDGSYMLIGAGRYTGEKEQAMLIRIDAEGEILSEVQLDGPAGGGVVGAPHAAHCPDGGFVIAGHALSPGSERDIVIAKTNASGEPIWQDTISRGLLDFVFDVYVEPDGSCVITGTLGNPATGVGDLILKKYDPDGTVRWSRVYAEVELGEGRSIAAHPLGGYIVAGQGAAYDPLIGINGFSEDLWFRFNEDGLIYGEQIVGQVFYDINNDCAYQGEQGLQQWFIKMESPEGNSYAISQDDGFYSVNAFSNNIELSIANRPPYWTGCSEPVEVVVNPNASNLVDLPQRSMQACPYMSVDVSTPLLRRCFDNEYTVSYCNNGTAIAENSYVEIKLDAYLQLLWSTIPSTTQLPDNTYRFDLGNVGINECNKFKFTVNVDCDVLLGQTHCVEAHIYPDSACIATLGWSGASTDVKAECEGDSVLFIIENVGNSPTADDLQYLVIEDEVILLEGSYQLGAGAQKVIRLPANGSTYRLEALQEPNHPGMNQPVASIEGCTNGNPADISLGFVNQYWENDADQFVAIDCQENVGSYDPNDKKAFSKGYGSEHYITPNQELEYLIRFQNTGTDTAFQVVIRDPISPFLEIGSIQLGTSSHPYTADIVDGNVLEFTFDNIMLPDSNINEPLSHGFVKFKIQQLPDLPLGTLIENEAAIFFDFNDPIITNTTFHTIAEDFIPYAPDYEAEEELPANVALKAYPNPFSESAVIMLSNYEGNYPVEMQLYDVTGTILRTIRVEGPTIEIKRQTLNSGIYFYKVKTENRGSWVGKLVIH